MAFCNTCGKQLMEGELVCTQCGTPARNANQNSAPVYVQPKNPNASIPAFVLGLIGAIFGLFGGLCVSACASVGGNEAAPLLLIVGGSIVGLIGACMCFKKAKKGAILELVAAVMIAICAFGITGADFSTLIGMVLLAIGGLVGFLTVNKK